MTVLALLILTAVLIWGITPVMDKTALKETDPLTGVIIRSITVFIAAISLMIITGRTREVIATPPKALLLFSISGLLAGFVAMIAYFGALRLEPASKIIPLVAIYPLLTVISSVIFLGEKITLTRLIGTTLIISGLFLVLMKNQT